MIKRTNERLLRVTEVMDRVGMRRTTLYKRIKEGTFPSPIRISVGLVAWYESEVATWMSAPMEWRRADPR